MIQRAQLGQSPVEINPLGVGCWAWGDSEYWRYGQEHGPRDVVAAFDACLEAGLDFFDTAEAYAWGKGEQILGALARKSGRSVVIATKYAPLQGRGGPRSIAKGLTGSLKRLGLPRIDLYQLHWADRDETPIDATMEVLAEAVHGGQVRAVGVSNYRASEMREAHAALASCGVPLATNQVHYSLLHRSPEVDDVLSACRELGVTLLAYSPLEQGLLTGKYTPGSVPPGPRGEANWFSTPNVAAAQPVIEKLGEMAGRHGVEAATIAIAWLLAKGVVPLVGAKSGEQAARNAKAIDVTLAEAELAELDIVAAPWCEAR
jgi:aryl-alcohol dehydrogenase-like predicted oxidoreductase